MIKKRKILNNIALFFCILTAIWGLFWLFFILIDVIRHGLTALTPSLILNDPAPPGIPGGGLKHAIIGHFFITLTATLIGVPLGILGGTFLAEYGRNLKVSRIISFLSDIMVSVPAIIVGAFVYALFVRPVGHFNALSGGLALAIIMIPVIVKTTENMLSLIPWTLREAAFALGAPYYKVIFQIVYRGAGVGIFTGVILAIARVTGEAAPLLFTSFNNAFTSYNLFQPMASLTVTIFQYAMGPYEDWHRQAWGASFLITLFILFLAVLGRYLIKRRFRS
ncbi:phosphate transporter permease subunit PtsA [Caldimicrobium thiodismutans]|uniref:Phosphate transport system permease protein PstA n=1 Tax=Caldimicrobium thiodismutans TaxID=1653476 RepID=A0A0U5B5R5_9BACT|nr:phosphate ABC transporter permease PstA [Caldimicrobium thiodismutans]BAU23424.1 phosphate transporter permease subunit PtsA [Caldimicrobium thiodismutans]